MCNGHADTCDPADPESDTSILVCRCQHNTCGTQCAACCPGFEQKKWRISQNWDRFECERMLTAILCTYLKITTLAKRNHIIINKIWTKKSLLLSLYLQKERVVVKHERKLEKVTWRIIFLKNEIYTIVLSIFFISCIIN